MTLSAETPQQLGPPASCRQKRWMPPSFHVGHSGILEDLVAYRCHYGTFGVCVMSECHCGSDGNDTYSSIQICPMQLPNAEELDYH